MLSSTVRSTSNAPAARLRRAPFLVPDQPISATVFTSCPTNSLRSLRGTHSSSSTRTGTYHRLDALFQHSHRLLSSHRREVVEKVVQSMPIAGSLQTGDRRVRPRLGLRPGTPLASRDVPGERGRLSSCIWNLGFFPNDARKNCPFVLTAFTGWSSERCPGIGFLSRGDREIGVLRNVEPPTRPRGVESMPRRHRPTSYTPSVSVI